MRRLFMILALTGIFSFGLSAGPTVSVAQAQVQTSTERLLQVREQLLTQYRLYGEAHDTARYSLKVNGRVFDASAKVARDEDFATHDQRARDAYNAASRAYARRDAWTAERELRTFESEVRKMNAIGWYKALHKLRTSSDTDVQQKSYDEGYRDNKTWEQWNTWILQPKTKSGKLYRPEESSGAGEANFGPGPDFNDRWEIK